MTTGSLTQFPPRFLKLGGLNQVVSPLRPAHSTVASPRHMTLQGLRQLLPREDPGPHSPLLASPPAWRMQQTRPLAVTQSSPCLSSCRSSPLGDVSRPGCQTHLPLGRLFVFLGFLRIHPSLTVPTLCVRPCDTGSYSPKGPVAGRPRPPAGPLVPGPLEVPGTGP